MCTTKLLIWQLILLHCAYCFADVSHLFAAEYPANVFQQIPPQVQYFHNIPQFAENDLETQYGPPAIQNPAKPITPVTAPSTTSTTTEFVLPEVVDNRQAKERGNFVSLRSNYLPPSRPYLPPLRAELPFSSSHSRPYSYEKPRSTTTTTNRPNPIVVADTPMQVFGYNYQVPQQPVFSTPAPVYLPPQDSTLNVVKVAGIDAPIKVQEMRCLKNNGGYFRAVLQLENALSEFPLVDNDSFDKRCQVRQAQNFLVLDIAETDFQQCGITDCANDLCLRLRFPVIPGLRTALDGLLTLHCKTQQRVTAKQFSLKMGVTNDIQSRSLGAYAHGGTQNPLRTHVELLRKTANGFTHHLAEKETVKLGEELLLRAHVLTGDGWNYTKLTDVSLERISPSGESLHAVLLINSHGCVNPSMLSICPQAPNFDPPLGHKLHFKAVMFQGMRSGDELILSMRISACLEVQDCHVLQQHYSFDSAGFARRKRNTSMRGTNSNQTNLEATEISRISFRVAFNETERNATTIQLNPSDDDSLHTLQKDIVLLGVLGFIILLITLGIFVILKLNSRY